MNISHKYINHRCLEVFGIPILILALNLVLKILFLDSRDLAMDEPFTVFYSQSDLSFLFRILPYENNPPLHFIFLHYWIKLFGISPFSVRFPSMLFSAVTAMVLYETGRRFFSRRTGLIGAGIFTFSNYNLLFAHEARVYALFALLASVSMLLFLTMHSKKHNRLTMALMTLMNLFLIYAHFFGFFIVIIQLLSAHLIPGMRKTNLRMTAISAGIVIMGFLPYAGIAFLRFSGSSGGTWVAPPVWSDLYTMVWRYSNAPVVTVVFLSILGVAGISYLFRRRSLAGIEPCSVVILLWFLFPYLFMFFISFRFPVFLDRYTVFISLPFYLLIGLALDGLFRKKWLWSSAAVFTLSMMIVTFTPDVDNKRRLKELVSKCDSMRRQDTYVVICPEWLKFGYAYHAEPQIFRDYEHFTERLYESGIFPANRLSELDTAALGSATNVIFIEEWASLVDKDGSIKAFLASHFPHIRSWSVYESFTITDFRE